MSPTRVRSEAQELVLFESLWRDERAAATLYRGLANLADDERATMFTELAQTETRHAEHWADLLRQAGRTPVTSKPSWRVPLLLWWADLRGIDAVLPHLVRAEVAGRERYHLLADATPEMADEEASHGRALALATGGGVGQALAMADGRHRTSSGGQLRAAVFGVNDGLVSNFALILGVAGGSSEPSTIVLAGIAGLVAGAASMAAGEWVSVRSQRELYEHEIAVEQQELDQFPEDEKRELELIYRAKGLDESLAGMLADRIMESDEVALDTLVREELGLNPSDLGSPWAAGISSFLAFAAGALVPLLPFLIASGGTALLSSALLSALALALVGSAIAFFTGRPLWWSAVRMLLIGGGAASVTYLVGSVVGVAVS